MKTLFFGLALPVFPITIAQQADSSREIALETTLERVGDYV
ncbi:hypothetical protein [uncultured Kriegella sp.]|tara:strand:- start:178225 stop:178347 length:123 start_codon:yes stop_codon:yes gene_type:complete